MRVADASTTPISERGRSMARASVEILLLGAVYYGGAELGLSLALVGGQVTPLWPPTGIALVALIVFGPRVWPGIFLGAFFVNLPISESALAAGGIAVGNTLAPVVAAHLLRRVGFRPALDRLRDVLALVFVGGVGMAISATGGTAVLTATGSVSGEEFAYTWSVWWTGDTMGVILVAPFLLMLRAVRWRRPRPALDVLGQVGLLAVATAILVPLSIGSREGLLYALFPLAAWAAWRFQLRGASALALLISSIVTWAAAQGFGPFAGDAQLGNVLRLHAFNGTLAITSFLLAAVRTQNLEALRILERARIDLRAQVRDRASDLTEVAGELAAEMDQRRQAEEALRDSYERERDAAERLREADRDKDEFLSVASHELRAPLTGILGFSESLVAQADALDPSTRADLVKRIRTNALGMAGLIEQILDDSRLHGGKIQIHPRPLDLRAALEDCVDAHASDECDHPVSVHAPSGTEVLADPDCLRRILGNLLGNAAKFSAPGSPIVVTTRGTESHVVISVHDEGMGIAPEEQALIFRRFHRGSTGRGVGLGLSIVQRYVELLGGMVWLESEPDQGSTFSFTLPRASRAAERVTPGAAR